MAREPLVIGPFAGGLNTYDDPTAVRDTELVECLNWDPGLEGSLRSRPPFQDLGTPMTLGATGNMTYLGIFYGTGNEFWVIASDGLNTTYSYHDGAWAVLTSTFSASAMVQFDNKAWLLAPVVSTNPGGYWSPSGGFVADSNMPKGETIVSHKSRLWVSPGKGNPNGTRMYYSKVLGQPNFWTTPSFIDIGQGDGQDIVLISTYYNSLVIFRTQSIYSFSYTTDPAQGVVNLLVPGTGLSSKHCLISHENYLYFMYDEKAFQFVNNNAQQINLKVPFTASQKAEITIPYSVSLFNNRAIFHYFDTMYVFSLRTRTWTKWKSTAHGAIGQLASPSGVLTDEAYAFPSRAVPAGGTRQARLLYITDRVTNATEDFTCEIRTKNYNYQLSSNFKRLFWWGVDAVFRGRLRGAAIPVVQTASVTWGRLYTAGVTWGTLLATGTWGRPSDISLDVLTDYSLTNSGPSRKFVKMFKSLRFRQIYFTLIFDTDGSLGTAPVNLFTITAYVGTKETVVKTVS